ncbi:MAG TPA: alkaline phosphatase D family protein [Trebonia sp.]
MTTGESAGPGLVLGPMLRYVGETEATVWVETDRECEVEILGHRSRTFAVAGHHYGLLVIAGLTPGSEQEYQVALDGVLCWPLAGSEFPPSVLRTLAADQRARIAFGSCRVAEIAPWNLGRRARRQRVAGTATKEDEGTDALAATAVRLARVPRGDWPDALLMIGDQVYADEPGPATRQFIAEHRARERAPGGSAAAPGDGDAAPDGEVADFEEYCALYREAWSTPEVRWLFSVVPTAMIFDDHDVHDDWNISAAWRRQFAALPWWGQRIESAYQSYWVYQHLGNLSPQELAADETWQQVCETDDGAAVLARLAHRADQREPGVRWSVRRAFGRVRVILLDSRSRRVVDGGRLMADDGEWQWLTESVSGDWEHVVLATSVPPLLPRGIHTLEAWSERISDGAWGQRAARFGERLRQAVDLEHWPAFDASFARLEQLLTGLATGQYGEPPVTVTVISGDIHHSYLTAVDLPHHLARTGRARPAGTTPASTTPASTTPATTRPTRTSAVWEAVCSPFHQAMPPKMRGAQQLASTRVSGLIGTAVATLAGARAPGIRWRITEGPWFQNMIAVLEFDGPAARVRFDRADADASGTPRLTTAAEARLS